MPEFILDTGDELSTRLFAELDRFTQGYIEALFFTNQEPDALGDANAGQLASVTLVDIQRDCATFQQANAALLTLAYGYPDYDEAAAGRDLWYTRNGHGVGYWDRGLNEIGDVLSALAHKLGESDAYLGDDGRIYVT